jgi:transposase InsO family protein
MQQKELGYGVYGWVRIRRYAVRMENVSKEATLRLEALKFWGKHGLEATQDFYKISRRTLFRWKQLYQGSSDQAVSLNNQSRAPRTRRVREWPAEVMTRLRELRQSYPSLGAEKLQLFLADWCEPRNLPCPKVRTILRLIAERPELKKAKPPKVSVTHRKAAHLRKPKGFKATYPGQCVGVDTIEIQRDGQRRYISTFTDINSRFALAVASTNRSSKRARVLWRLSKACFPYPIERVLSDNGSEFKAAFDAEVAQDGVGRWLTYPKTPKMNAHVERFNGSIQVEFIAYHEDLLFTDVNLFNDKLLDYLVWFNTERPHYGLGLISPYDFLKNNHQCNMYWRETHSCIHLCVMTHLCMN